MKTVLTSLLALCFCLPVTGAGKKPLTKEGSAKVIEAAIRKDAKKPTGELTEADLEKVTTLYLGGNQLTDLKGLKKLTKLKDLHLDDNNLTHVPKGLENLKHLTHLNLGYNRLTCVKGLENLMQLEALYLHHNKLTDIKSLEKLPQLMGLYLSNNPDLTKAQINELQKVLPKCKINSNPKK